MYYKRYTCICPPVSKHGNGKYTICRWYISFENSPFWMGFQVPRLITGGYVYMCIIDISCDTPHIYILMGLSMIYGLHLSTTHLIHISTSTPRCLGPRPERARRPLTEILQGLGYAVDRIFSHSAMLGSVRTAHRMQTTLRGIVGLWSRRKTIGNPWEIHRKSIGKWWFNGI